MRAHATEIIKEISIDEFNVLIEGRRIILSSHALDHLSTGQRKVFKGSDLVDMLGKEPPRKVYLQKNGRYAACYRRPDGYRKLIVVVNGDAIIVSFMDIDEVPRFI